MKRAFCLGSMWPSDTYINGWLVWDLVEDSIPGLKSFPIYNQVVNK